MVKEQPKALQFADYLEDRANELQTWIDENDYVEFGYRPDGLKREQSDFRQISSELRRLHQSETEAWRYADELEQERKKLSLQVLQLIDAIEDLMYWDNGKAEWEDARNLIKEIQEEPNV